MMISYDVSKEVEKQVLIENKPRTVKTHTGALGINYYCNPDEKINTFK